MTPRHRRFIEEYLVDLNASQAARRVGYTEKSCRNMGSQLLKRPDVKAAVEAALEERGRSMRVTSARVLLELARVAFADPTRIAEWGPAGLTLRPHDTLSPDDRAAIQEIVAFPDGGPTRIRLHDKQRALALLARHLGLLNERTAGVINGERRGKEIVAAAARARKFILERIARAEQQQRHDELENASALATIGRREDENGGREAAEDDLLAEATAVPPR